MIVTTTPSFEGKQIIAYLGLVTGEAIMGANVVRDFLAGITDIVGGRSAEYEQELAVARKYAVTEMTEKAVSIGANAVVGVDFDYETIGANGSMLMVSVSGTAVTVVDETSG